MEDSEKELLVQEISKGESTNLDFKGGFDPTQTGDWCELTKDIVAIANSGGGRILVGLDDDGKPSGESVAAFFAFDPADLVNKIHKYTAHQFTEFFIERIEIAGGVAAVMTIRALRIPIIFSAREKYEWPAGKKKSAFNKGTIYFRHGAKREPGTSDDLRSTLERELERVKGFWLNGIAKIVRAPPDAEVQIVPSTVSLGKDWGRPTDQTHDKGQWT